MLVSSSAEKAAGMASGVHAAVAARAPRVSKDTQVFSAEHVQTGRRGHKRYLGDMDLNVCGCTDALEGCISDIDRKRHGFGVGECSIIHSRARCHDSRANRRLGLGGRFNRSPRCSRPT